MQYTVIVKDRSYDLPPMTATVADKMESILKVDGQSCSLRQKYGKIHEGLKSILGEEQTADILGSKNFEEVDCKEMVLLVQMINDAYEAPMREYKAAQARERFASIPTDKIAALVNGAQMASAQTGK